MKDRFIPYPLAVLAKEKGFTAHCFAFYQNKKLCFQNDADTSERAFVNDGWLGDYEKDCAAPLYQQIIDWFICEHNIVIEARLCSYGFSSRNKTGDPKFKWKAQVFSFQNGEEYFGEFYKPMDALDKAIEEAFKLI